MLSLNLVRGCLYGVVLVWTLIVFALAVHMSRILDPSDLTHFIPLAIFVSSATFLVLPVLLVTSLWKRFNTVQSRVELGSIGLIGLLWLILGALMAASEMGDVECFSDDGEEVDVAGFSTSEYHSQYRAMTAFSVFNVLLLLGFALFLVILAIRHHRLGHRKVWITPVTKYSWFDFRAKRQFTSLPPPVTHKRTKSDLPAPVVKVSLTPPSKEDAYPVAAPPAAVTRDTHAPPAWTTWVIRPPTTPTPPPPYNRAVNRTPIADAFANRRTTSPPPGLSNPRQGTPIQRSNSRTGTPGQRSSSRDRSTPVARSTPRPRDAPPAAPIERGRSTTRPAAPPAYRERSTPARTTTPANATRTQSTPQRAGTGTQQRSGGNADTRGRTQPSAATRPAAAQRSTSATRPPADAAPRRQNSNRAEPYRSNNPYRTTTPRRN